MRILIIGVPGSPIFEVADRLSGFRNYELYTIERNECLLTDLYFADKIPQVDIDAGDFTSGSESQQYVRDPQSRIREKLMDLEKVPDGNEGLTQEELNELLSIENGVIASELADPRLLEWCEMLFVLESDTKKAQRWFENRRKCKTCGSVYHLEDKNPKEQGICDRCGSNLIRKPEDEPVNVQQQYMTWKHIFWKFEETIKQLDKKHLTFKRIDLDNVKTMEEIVRMIDREIRDKVPYSGLVRSRAFGIPFNIN